MRRRSKIAEMIETLIILCGVAGLVFLIVYQIGVR